MPLKKPMDMHKLGSYKRGIREKIVHFQSFYALVTSFNVHVDWSLDFFALALSTFKCSLQHFFSFIKGEFHSAFGYKKKQRVIRKQNEVDVIGST